MAAGRSKDKGKSSKSSSSPVLTGINKQRKTRNVFSLENKIKVVGFLESGMSEREIVHQLAADGSFISRSQVNRISNSKVNLINISEKKEFRPEAKILKNRVVFPDISQAVYDWFLKMRNPGAGCKPLPISRTIIRARALHEARVRGIINFKASDGWFYKWRIRFNVGDSTRLFGEAGDVDLATVGPIIEELKRKLAIYKRRNIFNMDESGLLYRALPSRTYLSPATDQSRQNVSNIYIHVIFT